MLHLLINVGGSSQPKRTNKSAAEMIRNKYHQRAAIWEIIPPKEHQDDFNLSWEQHGMIQKSVPLPLLDVRRSDSSSIPQGDTATTSRSPSPGGSRSESSLVNSLGYSMASIFFVSHRYCLTPWGEKLTNEVVEGYHQEYVLICHGELARCAEVSFSNAGNTQHCAPNQIVRALSDAANHCSAPMTAGHTGPGDLATSFLVDTSV